MNIYGSVYQIRIRVDVEFRWKLVFKIHFLKAQKLQHMRGGV